jgi:hypothetical protein
VTVQDRPRCFECEYVVEYDAVYSPPFCEHEECSSAVFHGLCLMAWREKRDQRMAQLQNAKAAFIRHLQGECGCPPQEQA